MNRTDYLIWLDWLEEQGKNTLPLRLLYRGSSSRKERKGLGYNYGDGYGNGDGYSDNNYDGYSFGHS